MSKALDLIVEHELALIPVVYAGEERTRWLCYDKYISSRYGDEWWWGGDDFLERYGSFIGKTPLEAVENYLRERPE